MKPWYKSRTIWINLMGGLAMLFNGPLAHLMPMEYTAFGLAAVNVALRLITTQGVTLAP